jgi:uncharacterized pyridoxamine 5'-phosphate oxidase family protein
MIPNLIFEKLASWFGFPKRQLFAQVATCCENRPRIRTMQLFEITAEGHLIFLTHKETQKWRDLTASSYIAALLVHLEFGQLTVHGRAILSAKSELWKSLNPMIRKIYTEDPGEKMPDAFGVIAVEPQSWELLALNKADYNQSLRRQFVLEEGSWKYRDLKPL